MECDRRQQAMADLTAVQNELGHRSHPDRHPILTCGAIPIIVDTKPGALATNPADVQGKVSPYTKAAIALPLWGYPVDDHHTAAFVVEGGLGTASDDRAQVSRSSSPP
jgi:hypothetical protein